MISFIDSVEAKTDQEVTFNLKYPFPAFKERLALIKVAPASMSNDELTAQPIGSGPWKYANITDQKVTFVKNDLYNGDYHKTVQEHGLECRSRRHGASHRYADR